MSGPVRESVLIVAFSVDNVLQRIADPVFVGATILSVDISTKRMGSEAVMTVVTWSLTVSCSISM